MEIQGAKGRTFLKKQQKIGDINTFYKTVKTTIMCYWHQDRQNDQQQRVQSRRALERSDWACPMIGGRTDFTTDRTGIKCHMKKLSCIHRQIDQLPIN